MNKGLILETHESEATVMTPEGEFKKVKKRKGQTWQVGEEVDIPPLTVVPYSTKRKKKDIPTVALAASVLLVIISFFTFVPFGLDNQAIAYVNVDINPSVEMAINKSMEVVSMQAINEDGLPIVTSVDEWKGKPLSEVTFLIIKQARDSGYFDFNRDVLVTTSFIDDNTEQKYEQNVNTALQLIERKVSTEHEVEGANESEQVLVHKAKANEEVRVEAQERGVSTGRYTIYLGAQENGIELDIEEVQKQSITQLADMLQGLTEEMNDDFAEGDTDQYNDHPGKKKGHEKHKHVQKEEKHHDKKEADHEEQKVTQEGEEARGTTEHKINPAQKKRLELDIDLPGLMKNPPGLKGKTERHEPPGLKKKKESPKNKQSNKNKNKREKNPLHD